MMPKLTLDTNLLLEYWKKQNKVAVVEKLLELSDNGRIDLVVTSRIHADIDRPPLSERINELPELGVQIIGSVFRLDYSALDGGDMLGDDEFMNVFATLEQNLKHQGKELPDWRDSDHLHGHYLAGRDTFLTWDGGILSIAPEIEIQLGIVVMQPEEYLATLDEGD